MRNLKTAAPLILGILILIIGGAAVYFGLASKSSIDHVLPPGPLVYIHAVDVAENLEKYWASPVGQQMQKINIEPLIQAGIRSGDLTDQEIERYDEVMLRISSPMTRLWLERLFGQEFALGLYLKEGRNFSDFSEDPSQVLEDLVVVSRVGQDVQLADIFSKMGTISNETLTVEEGSYQGHGISTVRFKQREDTSGTGQVIVYSRLGDLLVIGFSEDIVRSCLDRADGRMPALNADSRHQKISSRFFVGGYVNGYGDFSSVSPVIRSWMETGAAADEPMSPEEQRMLEKSLDDVFGKLKGFETVAFSFGRQKENVSKQRYSLFYDPNELDPALLQLYSCEGRQSPSLAFIPQNVVGFQWNNCVDFPYFWGEIQKEIRAQSLQNPGAPDSPRMTMDLGGILGVNIERDLLPALGDEAGMVLGTLGSGSSMIPEGMIFIKMNNPDVARRLMDRLGSFPLLKVDTENVEGIPTKYFSLPGGLPVKPAYGFIENYLVIVTHQNFLKQAILAFKDRADDLTSNPVFKSVDFGLTAPNNALVFWDLSQLSTKIQNLAGWVSGMAAIEQQRLAAFQSGQKKRLTDLQNQTHRQEAELNSARAELAHTNDEIVRLRAHEAPADYEVSQASRLKLVIDTTQKDLAAAGEKIQELQTEVEAFQDNDKAKNLMLAQLVWEEILVPVLEGLSFYEAMGMKTQFKEGLIETEAFIKSQ